MSLAEIESGLRDRRDELRRELEAITSPPEPGASVGFGKRIGDGTSEAVERLATTATARSLSRSLEEVELALQRIQEGAYGLCDVCCDPIPSARMAARPASTRCVACAT